MLKAKDDLEDLKEITLVTISTQLTQKQAENQQSSARTTRDIDGIWTDMAPLIDGRKRDLARVTNVENELRKSEEQMTTNSDNITAIEEKLGQHDNKGNITRNLKKR